MQTFLVSDESTTGDHEEEEEDDEDGDDESDHNDYDYEDDGERSEHDHEQTDNDDDEDEIEPFVSSWCFAMGTQRSVMSSVGEKAPKSNVKSMEDWELDVVERAHRESHLAELYADLSWRFYTHPPTSFCLARVFLRHGLTGNEGVSSWSELYALLNGVKNRQNIIEINNIFLF